MLPCCPFANQIITFFTQTSHSSCEGEDLSKIDSSKSTEKCIELPHSFIYLKGLKIQLKSNAGTSERELTQIFSVVLKLFGKEKVYCEVNQLQKSFFFYQDDSKAPVQCLTFYPRSQSGSRSLLTLFGEEKPSEQIALIRKIESTYQKVELI